MKWIIRVMVSVALTGFMAFVLTDWQVTKATLEADGCEVIGLTIDGVWYCIDTSKYPEW